MRNVSILAFDFGLRRIGVAIGHTETGTVHPLNTIDAGSGRKNREAAKRLMAYWEPDLLVVGLPGNNRGRDHPLWPHLLKFAQELWSPEGPPLYFADESHSSLDAESRLREAEISGIKAKPYLDMVAAQVILEGLLADGHALPYREGMVPGDLWEKPTPQEALIALGIGRPNLPDDRDPDPRDRDK